MKDKFVGLRACGFEKNTRVSFYSMKFDVDIFKTKLELSDMKQSSDRCNFCTYGTVRKNILETMKVNLVGTNPQAFYKNPWFLVSTRHFIDIMRKHDIIGYQVKKIKVVNHDLPLEHSKILQEISIKGMIYGVHNNKGVKVIPCPICGQISQEEKMSLKEGRMFDIEDWDGSDIFRFSAEGYIFVTEKFKRMIEEERIEGITFEELQEIDFDNSLQEIYYMEG